MNISLPKSKGTPVPKDPNVILIDCDDVLTWPARDSNGVLITANLTLKPGKKAIAFYATPSTISRNDESSGDADYEGFTQKFSCERPGDDLRTAELVQNGISKNFIVISTECSDSNGTRLQGTKCNPMKLKYTGTDNKDAKKGMFEFSQAQISEWKMAHYRGTIPTLADYEAESSEESSI